MATAANSLALPRSATTEWIFPVATVATVLVMIIPVPAVVLDLFLAISITLGVLVLLSALYILKPVQFSVFPTLLLFLTLFRISLNIASSRRILLHGTEGSSAAGSVIKLLANSSLAEITSSASSFSSHSSPFNISSSITAPSAPPKWPRASPSTPSPANKWPSMPTSTPATSMNA